MAWLTGWSYRKSHEIEGSTAGAQTNYQIRIKVHRTTGTDSGEDVYVGTKCRADFGDIRFTKADGETLLDYWLENEETAEADGYGVFWVEVDSIPASPDTATIYIYYGKSDATTTSDGEATFLFFDHFEGTSIDTSKWSTVIGDVSVSDSWVYVRDLGAQSASVMMADSTFLYHIAFRIKAKILYLNGDVSFGLRLPSPPYDGFLYYYLTDTLYAYTYDEGSRLRSEVTPLDTNVHIWEASWISGKVKFWIDGTLKATHTSYVPDENIPPRIAAYAHTSGVNAGVALDWFVIRKYVEPEPSHGAWGSEETPGVAHEVTVSELLGLADSVVKRADYSTLVSGAEKLGLAESITKRVDYKTLLSGTEKLALIDEAAVQTVIPLLVAEKLGLIDEFAKRVDYKTLVGGAEKLGITDRLVKRVDYGTLQSGVERLGLSDAGLLKRQIYILMAEKLGLVSRVRPTASYHLYIEEKLGLKERVPIGRPIYIEVTEKLGLVDREKILLTLYTPAVTVPANTPKDAPVTYMLYVEEDYITSIDVYFPPGCCGLCRVQAYYGSEQLAPKPTGADFRGDNMLVRFPMRWKVPEKPCPIRFVLWNLDDTYSHTPIILVSTAEEEQVKPYKPVSEFVNLFKRLLGIRG